MKRVLFYVLFTALVSGTLFSQETTPKGAFLSKWDHSAAYLMGVIDSIPADSLHYKPTEKQMSVADQLQHIRMNMLWLGHSYFNPASKGITPAIENPGDKEELRMAMQEAFESVHAMVEATDDHLLAEEVEFFAGPMTRLQILNLLQDHVTHHRAQLIVYLNLMGLTPPPYTGW